MLVNHLYAFFLTFRKTGRVKLQGFTDLLAPIKTDRFTFKGGSLRTSLDELNFLSNMYRTADHPINRDVFRRNHDTCMSRLLGVATAWQIVETREFMFFLE